MDGILDGVVAKFIEAAFSPLCKVVSYTYSYRSKVASLQDQTVELDRKLTDVKGIIADAQRNGKEILHEASNWLTDSETALREALDLNESSGGETRCWVFTIGDCNCKRRYRMADKAVKLSEDIGKLMITARTFNESTVSKRARPQRLPATYAHPYKALPSMEGYLDTLKGALVGNQKREIIGVYGLKGAGKTLLVKKLAVELDSDSHDEEVSCVVYVSAAMELRSIQEEIAERVGLDLQPKSVQERWMWLTARLVEIGNVVFIIDDVEANGINLGHFGIPWFDQNKNGCRFVVVSSSLNICNQISTQMQLEVQSLSKEESLHLFKELAKQKHGEGSSNTHQRGIDHISSRSTWLAGEIVEYYNKLHSPMGLKPEGIELVTVKLEGSTPLKAQNEVWAAFARGESRIGIRGMGGVGKTTVAMHLNNEILSGSREDFKHVYYITVSKGCSVQTLQKKISIALELTLKNEDEPIKAAPEIRKSLEDRVGTLLILDDMWEHITMDEVGVAIGDSCKLLITTRKKDVCDKMSCKTIVEMKPLLDDEAWDLFVSQLEEGYYESLSDEAKSVAKSIAIECSGLPLGIITTASCMRGQSGEHVLHGWRDMLRQLRNPSAENEDMEDKVFRILRVSYEHLSNAELRECFLYCALYPEDDKISRDELIGRFIAMELIDESTVEENIDKGHSLLNALEGASLLESVISDYGRKRCVKMHDLVRDMAIEIIDCKGMVEAGKGLKKIPGSKKWKKDLIQVSLMRNRIEYIRDKMCPECPNLSVLLLRDNPLKNISESFFVHMVDLKILDLSQTSISELPDSISNLCNLRSLLLRGCSELAIIPSMARLTELRELDLSDSGIQECPEGVKELIKLECFLISCNTPVILPPKVMSRLRQLWRLEGRIGDADAFNQLVGSGIFNQLKSYSFNVGPSDYLVYSHVNVEVVRQVIIHSIPGRESNIGTEVSIKVPHNVQMLHLEGCRFGGRGLLDVIPSIWGATEELVLDGCEGIEYIISDAWFKREGGQVSKQLATIQRLEVIDLEHFVGLTEEGMVLPNICFDALTELSIINCPRLNKMCLHSDHLPNLKSMKLIDCGAIEEIFETRGGDTTTKVTCLPQLQKVELSCLEELKSICRKGVFFPQLRNLHVVLCSKLKTLGLLNQSMPDLKVIEIRCCEEMEEMFQSGDGAGDDVIQLPDLQKLTLLRLPELRSICRKGFFPQLRSVYVYGCSKLKSLGLVNQSMPYLKKIVITSCAEMEEIFQKGDGARDDVIQLPHLRELDLMDLPELRSICNIKLACESIERVWVSAISLDYSLHTGGSTQKSTGMKLENFPISVPRLVSNNNPPHPTLIAFASSGDNMPTDWWNSLSWNDPHTQTIFNKLGCFKYEKRT